METRNEAPVVQINGNETSVKMVRRDTRVKDHYEQQMKLYRPCTCGSGKKFKFCCKGKQMVVIDTGA